MEGLDPSRFKEEIMAITPATRVSQTLHKGGLPTTLPSDNRRQGNKVRNTSAGSAGITRNRKHGHPTVWVTADFDSPSLAKERLDQITEILTAAGYRVEPSSNPESHILNVWEPNWRSYLDEVGRLLNSAPEPRPIDWRAYKMRDSTINVHTEFCPAEPPGKSLTVRGRTKEALATELRGKLLPKSSGAVSRLEERIITFHDCITEEA